MLAFEGPERGVGGWEEYHRGWLRTWSARRVIRVEWRVEVPFIDLARRWGVGAEPEKRWRRRG